MNSAGLSKPQLERLHRVLSGHIERGETPGLVALVSHHDDTHVETLGALAFDNTTPMTRDTIFRIASLTKLVTADWRIHNNAHANYNGRSCPPR